MPPRKPTVVPPAEAEAPAEAAPEPKPAPEPVAIQPAEEPATPPPPEPTAEQYLARREALLKTVPALDKRPKTIYGKLAQILGLIQPVAKGGWNDFHRYNYAKESDLVEAVRPLLSEYGIFFWWTLAEEARRAQTKIDKRANTETTTESLTVVTVQYQFIDGESGERTNMQSITAYGDDPGDKGIYKALTGAVKYALMKTFLISTGDDPEADRATDRRSAAAEATSRVEVRRGGPPPRGRPQGQRPPAGPQPGPGGRQPEANAPAQRVLGDLLKASGEVHGSVDAANLIGKILGVTIPMEGEDKAGALATWLAEYQKDPQAYGKLVFDLRKYVEAKKTAPPAEPGTTGTTGTAAPTATGISSPDEVDHTPPDPDYEAGSAY